MSSNDIILDVQNLGVAYGPIHAVKDVSFSVPRGSVVTLIGANGAGKTTILRTISGLLKPCGGTICYQGKDIVGEPAFRLVADGLVQSPEGRGVFPSLTVKENLEMGAYTRPSASIKPNLEKVCVLFPRIKERLQQPAGTLSGGEQQMLAIGRALMSEPKLLLLDEPSLGLAPQIVKDIFNIILEINRQGNTVLLVEQNARMALQIANFGYVLETGKLMLSGSGKDLLASPEIQKAYLGGH